MFMIRRIKPNVLLLATGILFKVGLSTIRLTKKSKTLASRFQGFGDLYSQHTFVKHYLTTILLLSKERVVVYLIKFNV